MNEFISKIGSFFIKRLAELIGLSLITISILLLISLLSYSPEDPNFIFPKNILVKNGCHPKNITIFIVNILLL